MTEQQDRRSPWSRFALVAVVVVVLGGLAAVWFNSRLPAAYGVAAMGYPDEGGGTPGTVHMHGQMPAVSVTELVADPDRPADVRVDLVARAGPVRMSDGRTFDGYSLNGTTPGPTISAVVGQLVEVHVRNENVPDGMTLHWHGVDVPNSADGVAGVTQDAIEVGQEYVYRFVANQEGTYWYHSHQISHRQVLGGLLGALVVHPAEGTTQEVDQVAVIHTYGGVRTINGAEQESRAAAAPGSTVRVRAINTDNGPILVWVSGAPFRVLAVDGHEVNQPDPVTGQGVLVTAGGRADLGFQTPTDGTAVRVEVADASLVVGSGDAPSTQAPQAQVDLLTYGSPAPLPFDPAVERHFG